MSIISKSRNPIFLLGGGEMGERIRNFDWTKTPLGNPETWDSSLKTCVRILLTSPQPMFIWYGKKALVNIYNDAYAVILGKKHPSALGENGSVVWKELWNNVAPKVESVFNNEGTYDDAMLLIMQRKDYPEETYIKFSYSPISGEDAKVNGVFCVCAEETGRIIHERSLAMLRDLGAITFEEKSLNIIYQNVARELKKNNKDFPFAVIYKISKGETVTVAASAGIYKKQNIFPDEIDVSKPTKITNDFCEAYQTNQIVLSSIKSNIQDLPKGFWEIASSQFIHIPISVADKNHPIAVISAALNPYRKFDETFRQFCQLLGERISLEINKMLALKEETKRAETLAEIDQAKTVFFNNISHEFRTPLTLMLSPLEEALNEKGTIPLNQTRIKIAHRNAMRLLKLVNNLLDFSRIESGRQKAQFVPVDLVALTRNLASSFQSVIEKGGLEFIVDTQEVKEPVFVDKEMWEKIVLNLLSNAFKYTLEGSITVNLFSEKNQVILQVTDTGVGIPENEIPKLFQRFHRVKGNTGRSYEGTGIGLSLIKELVRLHSGTIKAASPPSGSESKKSMGSSFTVSIPAGKEHLLPDQLVIVKKGLEEEISNFYIEESASLLESANGFSSSLIGDEPEMSVSTVLIVDDNADMRDYLENLLQKEYHVVVTKNGKEALEKIHSQKITLVLTDIMMPVMDGIQLLKEIKQNPQTEQIPVIFLSARAGEEAKIEGYDIGADDYLVKPFSAKELLARIKSQIKIANLRSDTEMQLRNIFMQAPAAIAVVEGPHQKYVLANALYQKLFSRTEKQLLGKTIREVFPEAEGQNIFELIEEVYQSGKAFVAHEFPATFDFNGISKTGYYDFVVEPIKNADGKVDSIMLHVTEVTEQIESRKKIEESEKRFRSLAESLPQLIWMTNAKGEYEFVSKKWEEYSGVHVNSLIKWKSIVHPDDIENNISLWKKSISTGEVFKGEVRIKSKSGAYKWHSVKGEPIFDDENRIIKWVGAFTDINFIKKEQIRKDAFLSMASHELRTPVTTIKAYGEIAETMLEQKGDEQTLDIQRKMSKQVNKLTTLIKDLLDNIRIEKGKLVYTETFYTFNEMVQEIVDDMQKINATHKITNHNHEKIIVFGDVDKIGQVINNLITNAIKYSPGTNEIIVKTEVQKDGVQLSVRDFGIGISPEDLPHVFEQFYRVNGDSQSTFPGMGIGLFICAEIIQRQGGKIWVESALGNGSTFYIWLPFDYRLAEDSKLKVES